VPGSSAGGPKLSFSPHIQQPIRLAPRFGTLPAGSLHNAHQFTLLVVPVIVIVFIVTILFATSSKEDGHSTD